MGHELGRILVVDDEAALLEAICEGLAGRGFAVTGRSSAAAALDLLATESFDLLLTDLMMPEMDGISVVRRALELDPDLVCVLMTGQAAVQTAVEAMKAGAFDYVTKPFRISAVLPVLARGLELRRLRLDNVQLREMLAIYELSRTLSFTLDFQALTGGLVDAAMRQADADEASLLVPDGAGEQLRVAVVRGAGREHLLGRQMPIHAGVAGWVARHREPLLLDGKAPDQRFQPLHPRREVVSAITVPLVAGDTLVGVLNLNRTRPRPFSPGQVKALSILASMAAAGLEAARHYTAARQAEARYRSIFEDAVEGIFQVGPDGPLLAANPALLRMFGCASVAELQALSGGEAFRLFGDRGGQQELRRQLREYGTVDEFISQAYRKDGAAIWVSLTAHTVRDEAGATRYYQGTAEDITERKRIEAALEHQALHDPVTDLPNRTLFRDRVEQALRTARGAPLALLVVDLDRFKEVNDTLGHQVGDRLLQQVAQRLRDGLPAPDTLARLIGDEFGVLLPGADRAAATRVAERLAQALEADFELGRHRIAVRGAIGVALAPDHGQAADALLRCAESAMYAAKRADDRLAVYAPGRDEPSPTRLLLIAELKHAIESGGLLLQYQPQVTAAAGHLAGVEALVRWQHPQRGLVQPDEFIPLAEQTGLIGSLTRWVLSSVLAQVRAWREAGLILPVAVNLSMRDLHDPQLPPTVLALLQRQRLPADGLRLEVTESGVMSDPARALGTLSELRGAGIRVAIDDFGTGYSSLSYLKRLPVDEIKVDKTFVRDLARNASDRAITRAAVDLGHHLGLTVIAEGVEDELTWELLKGLGCDAGQGYYFSRPLEVSALQRWIGESPWGASAAIWQRPRQDPPGHGADSGVA